MEFILQNMKLKKIGISFDNIADFDETCLKEILEVLKKTY
jgi:hypothetical protein